MGSDRQLQGVIMNCDCDVILKESKCDLKKGQERYYCKMGKCKPLCFCSAILTCNAICPEL